MIKIGELLDLMPIFSVAQSDPTILAHARDIVRNGERGNRTEEQHLADAVKGIALEFAMMEYLDRRGYAVTPAPDDDKTYDFTAEIDGKQFMVDVKGRWRGSYWEATVWESRHAAPDVVYLCIDVFPDRFVHRGQCYRKNLEPGYTKLEPYVKAFSEIL